MDTQVMHENWEKRIGKKSKLYWETKVLIHNTICQTHPKIQQSLEGSSLIIKAKQY